MFNLEPKHVAVLIGFLGSLATSIAGLDHGWRDALTPTFVAGLIGQVSTILTAVYMGAPGALPMVPVDAEAVNTKRFTHGPYDGVGVLLLVGLCLMPIVGCGGHTNPNLTPAGQRAAQADSAVTRIGEVQQATIDASDAGKIAVADARVIVQWCVDVTKALAAAPDGWVTVAKGGYPPVRARLAAIPELQVWVPILDSLVGVM